MTTGSHVVTADDYSKTKELHAAHLHLPPNTFTVGGCSWRIKYSLNGFFQETADWICFALRLEPPRASVDLDAAMVRTSYSLLDQAGHPVPSSTWLDEVHTLPRMLGSWSYTQFMVRSRFESYYLKDNRFSVRCDVTVVTTTCRLSEVMPPPDMHRHFGELLATGVGADVTFEVGGKAFPAHRSVLAARSRMFKTELFGGGRHKEDEDGAPTAMMRVRIHDIELSVFRALLQFIYTDSLPEIDDASDDTLMARGLLVAAQRYELEGLQWICEDVLGILCPGKAARLLPSVVDQMRAKVASCRPF